MAVVYDEEVMMGSNINNTSNNVTSEISTESEEKSAVFINSGELISEPRTFITVYFPKKENIGSYYSVTASGYY